LIAQDMHIPLKTEEHGPAQIQKGTWLVILHAQRVPPHIGLMFSGNYNSLTIKEHEININSGILLKTITQKKIQSIFIKIVPHPVFSIDHQLGMFQEYLKTFGYVKQFETTCLSPIKLFFEEFYGIGIDEKELLFDFIQRLSQNDFIDCASSMNLELKDGISLPVYTIDELNEKIKTERQPYYND
jgi:hypothetical protein